MKKIILASFAFASIFIFHPALAAERSYYYDLIEVNVKINEDSTFDVAERLTYNFSGEYHQGWRSIPHKDISVITGVEVVDEVSGKALEYSWRKLDKTNPSNWGKYTTYIENGSTIVEWYYGAEDTSRAWTIKYKVHGGVGFYGDHDEIYWNLFTDFDVPIKQVVARVELPPGNFEVSATQASMYRTRNKKFEFQAENTSPLAYSFKTGDIMPKEAVTVAVGWPKGVVPEGAWWRDFFKIYWGAMFGGLAFVVCLLVIPFYWYFTERRGKGRGTIIPHYEPPQNLKPAIADIIVKERISAKAWPATVVDLAVRGYISIKEENIPGYARVIQFVLVPGLILNFTVILLLLGKGAGLIFMIDIVIVVLIMAYVIFNNASWMRKDYVLKRAKEEDDNLESYEKRFLQILFHSSGTFSTKTIRNNPERGSELYTKMKELKKELYKETERDTNAYEKPLSLEYVRMWLIIAIFGLGVFAYFLFVENFAGLLMRQLFLFFFLSASGTAVLYLYIRFEARLSREGAILREDWLGFKMYLETAERYRMQNLTPEIFEKYLPYAIIFGVEKKWARAFEAIQMPPPNWYHGGFASSGASAFTSSFSASSFSSSFSRSFATSFSPSSGGGASGGGGSAGGGGGGGGGGAS